MSKFFHRIFYLCSRWYSDTMKIEAMNKVPQPVGRFRDLFNDD